MNQSPHKIVSSLEAITSSIENDGQVYRWFAFLVTQQEVKGKLKPEGQAKHFYQKLMLVNLAQIFVLILILAILFAAVYFGKYIFLVGALAVLYPLTKLGQAKRRCVKEITRQLLEKDWEPAELGQKTLYQLSELYRRKYNIPSFIDAIYFADAITRKSVLLAVLCAPFVIQMNLWGAVFILVGAYYIPYLVATHPLVYRRLK
jgi:hypothetical protein